MARPATCAAYEAKSCATCAAVVQQLHSSEPAGTCQSSSAWGVSTASISATASSMGWPATELIAPFSQTGGNEILLVINQLVDNSGRTRYGRLQPIS